MKRVYIVKEHCAGNGRCIHDIIIHVCDNMEIAENKIVERIGLYKETYSYIDIHDDHYLQITYDNGINYVYTWSINEYILEES